MVISNWNSTFCVEFWVLKSAPLKSCLKVVRLALYVGIFRFYWTWKFEICRIFRSIERFVYKILSWVVLARLVHNFQTYPDFLDRSRSVNENVYRLMLVNHDQGGKPVTMCLVCLRPSNMASESILILPCSGWLNAYGLHCFFELFMRGRAVREVKRLFHSRCETQLKR